MTQREAAEHCGVSLRTVQNWTAGATPVPVLAEQALIILEAKRDAAAFEQDQQTLEQSCRSLAFIAEQQRARIARLEAELADEKAALNETLQEIANGSPQ
jgi:transcriptional regulator with XRE-family HTH domain